MIGINNVSSIDPNILINLMPNYSNLNLTYIRNNYMHALAPAFWTYNAFKNILFDHGKQLKLSIPNIVLDYILLKNSVKLKILII